MDVLFTINKFISTPTEVSFSYTTSDYNGFNISCSFSVDEITFQFFPSGGQLPYTYSIDGVNYTNSMSYTGLSSEAYNVSVQDANGCISTILVNLTDHCHLQLITQWII